MIRGRRAVGEVGPSDPIALIGGQVWDGHELIDAGVLAGRPDLLAVGSEVGSRDAPRVVDCRGLVLLPGFVDTHVHAQFADWRTVLAGGVTTARDLGSPSRARQLWASGTLRLRTAGRILTAPDGYPTQSWGGQGESMVVAGPREAGRAVSAQLTEGASVIKVAVVTQGRSPTLTVPTLRAVVAAAHFAGVRVTAHVHGAGALRRALEAGVDELAHLPLHDVTPQEMVRVAEAGMVVCPTLAIRGRDPGAARALVAFREAGGHVVYGTDLGNGGTAPGIMRRELRAMGDAGMTAAEVLRAATVDAAAHLGLERTGALEAGWRADVIAVRTKLHRRPPDRRDVRLVLAGGRLHLGHDLVTT